MAHRHLITFPCPCCGKRIELDTRNGKARALDKNPGGLDALLESHKSESKRLGDAFDSASSEENKSSEHLDELLRDARKRARENPDDDVPRPFDFD